jgi:hypothetical protein
MNSYYQIHVYLINIFRCTAGYGVHLTKCKRQAERVYQLLINFGNNRFVSVINEYENRKYESENISKPRLFNSIWFATLFPKELQEKHQ